MASNRSRLSGSITAGRQALEVSVLPAANQSTLWTCSAPDLA